MKGGARARRFECACVSVCVSGCQCVCVIAGCWPLIQQVSAVSMCIFN